MKQRFTSMLGAAVFGLWACTASAHHISGKILCTDTAPPSPLSGVVVEIVGTASPFIYTIATGADGSYLINVPVATDTYTVSIHPPAGLTIVSPAGGTWSVQIFSGGVGGPDHFDGANFNLTGCVEASKRCWMTAGGVKFEPLANEYLAEANNGGGPNDSFGGNVYPSCSQFPGDGGHWNHVSHRLKLHLNGQMQHVIKCGNVPGTAPGTDSPVCSVNFIHWEGWGTISPINGATTGKKVPVYYEAKVEDRAEPGNLSGAKNQPDDVDRYYIKVWYLNANGTIGAPVPGFQFGTYDSPIQITGGNLQIHCTSCN